MKIAILFRGRFNFYRCLCTGSGNGPTDDSVRVRFAPSPTGFVHIGGLRPIVYNYIFARSNPNGRFILRIEDTDRDRIVQGAAEKLESTLTWLGLEPDESPLKGGPYGPYVQSQRLELYQEAAKTLINKGNAYRCFCSADRLMLMKKEALKNRESVRYDNHCRSLTQDEIDTKLKSGVSFAIRFILQDDRTSFMDTIFGRYEYKVHIHEGDPVIMKRDGYPTYHLANVVDDHYMRISHVIRGEEWLMSTVKHLQLYRAFDWKPPIFAHLPVIMAQKGGKLSKRDSASNLDSYRENGYYPLALINFVLSTGGGFDISQKDKNKLYSLQELISMFNLQKVTTKSTRIEPAFLDRYNRLCMVKMFENSELIGDLRRMISEKFMKNSDVTTTLKSESFDDTYLRRILEQYLQDERVTTLVQLLNNPDHAFLWTYHSSLHPDLQSPVNFEGRSITPKEMVVHLEQLLRKFSKRFSHGGTAYTIGNLKTFLSEFEQTSDLNHRILLPYIRLLMTHTTKGLPVAEMFYLLGAERTSRRLEHGIDQLRAIEDTKVENVND